MGVRQGLFTGVFVFGATVIGIAAGCGSSNSGLGTGASSSGSNGDDGTSGSSSGAIFGSGSSGGDASSAAQCTGSGQEWACAVSAGCDSSSNTPTTLTGKVFDPAGANPLYNVIVFVPNVVADLPAVPQGTKTCNTCDVTIGDYVTATTTDATGAFTLKGVPTGMNVPITVQIGKWRRTTTVNITNNCSTNSVPDGTLRLPRKRSEGDLPQMALLTGGCDDMACFLTGLGLDPSEFGAPGSGGRLDVYKGSGMFGGTAASLSTGYGTAPDCSKSSCPLWQSKTSFESYDMVLLSCECSEAASEKPTFALNALHDWLDEGGKVFASHYHYYWFEDSPQADFKGVATWGTTGLADAAGDGAGADFQIDTTFPKGMTFGQWMQAVNALDVASPPEVKMDWVADSVKKVNGATNRWIYGPSGSTDVKYLSFDTPIGGTSPADASAESAKNYCGKAVFTDLHTGGSEFSAVSSVPTGCGSNAGKLSNQQKALEFLFFDLSACVQDDSTTVVSIPPK